MGFWQKYGNKLEPLVVRTVQYGTQFIVTTLTHNSYVGQGLGEAAGAAEKASFDRFLNHEQAQPERACEQRPEERQEARAEETLKPTEDLAEGAQQILLHEQQSVLQQPEFEQELSQAEQPIEPKTPQLHEGEGPQQKRTQEQQSCQEQIVGF